MIAEDIYYRRMLVWCHLIVRNMYFKHGHPIGSKEKLLFLGLFETAYIRRLL